MEWATEEDVLGVVYDVRAGALCVGGVSKTSPFSSVPLSGTQAAATTAAAAAAAAASRVAPVSPTGTQAAATTSGW